MADPFSLEHLELSSPAAPAQPRFFLSHDGINLAYYSFLTPKPKAVIIFYHGGGAYSSKIYQHMAEVLRDKYNISLYLVDIRGHGNSEGPRGDAPSEQHVWQDIDNAINFVTQFHAGIPLFLGGHSSGAGLILNYAAWKKSSPLAGYVLLAPFLGPQALSNRKHTDKTKRFIKKAKTWVFIAHALTRGKFFNNIPAVFFNYPESLKKQDSYILSYYTCAMAKATSPSNIKSIFVSLEKPFAVFIGSLDEQFLPQETVAHKDFAVMVKSNSYAEIIKDQTHLSIVTAAPSYIAKAIDKILKTANL